MGRWAGAPRGTPRKGVNGVTMAGEAALWRAWAGRAWGVGALRTTDGQPLQVVYTGRRRGAPGPDFAGALVVRGVAGRLEHGDVEVHLASSGWHAHGHAHNPAYAAVILHVVIIDDAVEPVRRPDGTPLPTLALGRYLEPALLAACSTEGAAQADLGPCRVAVDLTSAALLTLLEEQGRARLAGKAAALAGDIAALGDADQVLFRALMDAAGYSRNRRPCRAVADRLPLRTLQALCAGHPPAAATALCTAALLGMAGLLPPDDEAGRGLWEETRPLWPATPLGRGDWALAAVRPANRPEARLRGLAGLLARGAAAGLAATLLAPLAASLPAKQTAGALLAALRGPASGADDPSPGIGGVRAAEMLVNVVLPFALAWADLRRDPALAAAAHATLGALPGGGANETLTVMAGIIAPLGQPTRMTALQQQGLLRLHARHCALADCTACPLAGGLEE